jgi:23S rRNA (adenine2030-N6)-methyltransferase
MNYQHLYHAGSAADVFKHLILLILLDFMKLKDKPFCYIDSHAGYGEYDLTQLRIQEWRQGIGKLHQKHLSHPLLQQYCELTSDLGHFPGSPLIAKEVLRRGDEMILVEKSPEAFHYLKSLFHDDRQVHVNHLDAYHIPKALLPPPIRRGLVLIDPPYEESVEFSKLVSFAKEALQRFAGATYMIWYPIKARPPIIRFQQQMKKVVPNDILIIECNLWPDDVPIRLNGSGLLIINPPWKLLEKVHPLMNELIQLLKQHDKAYWRGYAL